MEIEEQREIKRQRERQGRSLLLSLQRFISSFVPDKVTSNYLTLMSSAISLQIQRNTVMAQKITPPDVAVNIPMNRFGVFDFDRAEEIIQTGYDLTLKALKEWEEK